MAKKYKVAINGFGRIGRLTTRAYFLNGKDNIYDIVAITTLPQRQRLNISSNMTLRSVLSQVMSSLMATPLVVNAAGSRLLLNLIRQNFHGKKWA
jgi:glyceraldehyde-3-phosphate dehydrogenase/erythrose-4-phosphate dehydrogenase